MMSAIIEGWPDNRRANQPGKPVNISNGGHYLEISNMKDSGQVHTPKENRSDSEKDDKSGKEEVDCFPICLSLQKNSKNTEYELPQPENCWLMRLFESTLFDMSIAIGYLFNSKEPGVQKYLGNRLFVSI